MKRKILLPILSFYMAIFMNNVAFAEIDLDLGDEPMDSSFGSSGYMKSGYATFKGGYDMTGNAEIENVESDIESSYCVSFEFLSMMGQGFGLGVGAIYQFARGIDESGLENSEFQFIPLYGLIKFFIPTTYLAPFGILHVGYNFFLGNDEFKGDSDLEGGLYWGVGGGIMLSNGLQFELLYSVDNGKIINDDSDAEMDVKYTKITLSAGFNF
ncbi:MAG: hypothetical protein JW864_09450 [Spirochaetes bacterium]|nr:hypothetical protein [Spirochaetota bacterium]